MWELKKQGIDYEYDITWARVFNYFIRPGKVCLVYKYYIRFSQPGGGGHQMLYDFVQLSNLLFAEDFVFYQIMLFP